MSSRPTRLAVAAALLVTVGVGVSFHARSAAERRERELNRQLIAAVQVNDAGAVADLLHAGADANAWDSNSAAGPVLMDAVEGPNDRIVRLLLAKGADPNRRDPQGETALMIAASNADPACVQALLDHGAEVNAKNQDGDMAWGYAASEGRADNIALLVRAGAIRPPGCGICYGPVSSAPSRLPRQ